MKVSLHAIRRRLLDRYGDRIGEVAKASQFIAYLRDLVRETPNLKAVLYLRVSGRNQNSYGNRRAAERRLRRELKKLGVQVIAVFREVGSGWRSDLLRREAAALYARKYGAVLVAESADRFLRSIHFSKENQSALPSLVEWEALKSVIGDVTLATLLRPDASGQEVRSFQTKRGIAEKNAHCGRPRKTKPGEKKRRRQKCMARVFKLRRTWGFSYGEIEAETGLPRSTFVDWLKRGGTDFAHKAQASDLFQSEK